VASPDSSPDLLLADPEPALVSSAPPQKPPEDETNPAWVARQRESILYLRAYYKDDPAMLAEIESWPSARFAPIPKYEPEAEPIFLPTLTAQADPPRTGPAQQDDGESHGLQAVEKDSPLPGASAPGPRHLAWPKLPTLTHQRLPLSTAVRCPRSRYPLTPVFPITCPQPQSLPHITREAPAKCPVSHT